MDADGVPTAASAASCASARDGRIVSSRPVLDAPVNKGHLCVRGRYAFDFVAARDRVARPMIRQGSAWTRVSWSTARAFVADRLRLPGREHGPDSLGFLGRATNEDNYVVQKFARAAIGTNNVDCCARVCHAPSAAALKRAFGPASTNSFDDIEIAGAILVCGANATESHPVIGARIRRWRARSARVSSSSILDASSSPARPTSTSQSTPARASPCCTRWPARSSRKGCRRDFIDRRVDGFDAFVRFLEDWPAERAAAICGVAADDIRRAARLYASTSPPALSVHGLGLTEHTQGTDGVTAHQPRPADRQRGHAGIRRQPAARPEQRAGGGAHGMRPVGAARIDSHRPWTRGVRPALGRARAAGARPAHSSR